MLLQRLLALFLGIWLIVLPDIMSSSQTLGLWDGSGTTTLPMLEEEDVHDKDVPPGMAVLTHHSDDLGGRGLADREALPLRSLHGEVPHQPPRS